mgnify:CR=1 FL=1
MRRQPAALHAAFASPATRYLDLDGSLDLERDVVSGGFSLQDGILRKRFRDARVHAALHNCTKSRPKLRAEAYTAEQLDVQLGEQMRLFVRDPRWTTLLAGVPVDARTGQECRVVVAPRGHAPHEVVIDAADGAVLCGPSAATPSRC